MAQKAQPVAKKTKFIDALGQGFSVTSAAAAAGVGRRTVYNWRSDSGFVDLWNDALESGADLLEDEARRRAVDGTEKPVFYNGRQVGSIREYSDSLLKFLLSAKRPQQFRERGTFDVVTHEPPPPPAGKYAHLSDDELAEEYKRQFGSQPGFAKN